MTALAGPGAYVPRGHSYSPVYVHRHFCGMMLSAKGRRGENRCMAGGGGDRGKEKEARGQSTHRAIYYFSSN
jgi:hypothetical protein